MLFWKSHFDFETSNFICLSGNTLHFLVKLVREDKPTVHFCTFYKKIQKQSSRGVLQKRCS